VTVEKFEYLNVWQNEREVFKKIYLITNKQEFKSDSGLKYQLQRAAVQ